MRGSRDRGKVALGPRIARGHRGNRGRGARDRALRLHSPRRRGRMSDEPIPLLLAEDEPTQRMLLARFLDRSGYRVTTAENGREAFEKVATGEFPILVSDWD